MSYILKSKWSGNILELISDKERKQLLTSEGKRPPYGFEPFNYFVLFLFKATLSGNNFSTN